MYNSEGLSNKVWCPYVHNSEGLSNKAWCPYVCNSEGLGRGGGSFFSLVRQPVASY